MSRTRRHPNGANARAGAVAQHGGTLPIYVCNACGADVVWVKSTRTGKPYLVNVSLSQSGARYYMGHNLHPRDCATQREAKVAAFVDELEVVRIRNLRVGILEAGAELRTAYHAGAIDADTLADASGSLLDLLDELGPLPLEYGR